MNLKKCDAAAIAALVALMAGSPIFANQAFAISSVGDIINSIIVGPCVHENGKFMYLVCSKFDPSLLTNGAAVKSLLLSNKAVVKNFLMNERPVLKSLLMGNATGLKSLLMGNATASK
jgi:hypothetical protein